MPELTLVSVSFLRFHVFHASKLKTVWSSLLCPLSNPIPATWAVDGEPAYKVRRVLNIRQRRSCFQYLVDHEGYGLNECSWVRWFAILDNAIVRDFHCRLAESFFYQRDLVIFFVGVCICVCIWLSNLSSSGTRLFLVSPLLAQRWLSSPVCNHSPAAISISSSPLVVELTTLVSTLVVKLLMLGAFTLWLPPVFGIYLFCADFWVWTSWRDCWVFCGENLENSVVVNKPVNIFFRVQHLDLTLRLFSKKPSSCSYKS